MSMNLDDYMALLLEKSIQKATEAKRANYDLMKALEELEWVKARNTSSRTKKKLLPPVPGTEHKYTRSYDMYIMTPAYAEYLRRTEVPRTEAPRTDLEELD